MKKQKKDFWDVSFNPVKGCNGLNGKHCPYCYAYRSVNRFGFAEKVARAEIIYKNKSIKKEPLISEGFLKSQYDVFINRIKTFKPTFFEYVLAKKLRKKPTIYFFSMSDPASWKQEWYERIVEKIAENMQHTFVVLTKHSQVYRKYSFPINTILGVTCINQKAIDNLPFYTSALEGIQSLFRNTYKNKLLLCIEPIQEKIKISELDKDIFDWIHVGQESGNRVGRIRATREMIEPFFDLKDIPVFMKNNLAGICGDRQLRKEFPA